MIKKLREYLMATYSFLDDRDFKYFEELLFGNGLSKGTYDQQKACVAQFIDDELVPLQNEVST